MGYATESSGWTLRRALSLETQEQLALFATLPPADFLELNGEYLGHAAKPRDAEADARQNAALFDESSPFGFWLGKAFKATSQTQGEGYNHCRKNGRVVRHLRFGTRMGLSYLDSKPAFLLTYSSFKNRSGAVDLTDEVRRLASGLYLCTATVQMPDGKRSKPTVFLLSGPVGVWSGPDDPNHETHRS
jgi:hypothetical protein